ncbi:hypothetical protein ACUXMN_000217 [Micrococcus yunnanensis]
MSASRVLTVRRGRRRGARWGGAAWGGGRGGFRAPEHTEWSRLPPGSCPSPTPHLPRHPPPSVGRNRTPAHRVGSIRRFSISVGRSALSSAHGCCVGGTPRSSAHRATTTSSRRDNRPSPSPAQPAHPAPVYTDTRPARPPSGRPRQGRPMPFAPDLPLVPVFTTRDVLERGLPPSRVRRSDVLRLARGIHRRRDMPLRTWESAGLPPPHHGVGLDLLTPSCGPVPTPSSPTRRRRTSTASRFPRAGPRDAPPSRSRCTAAPHGRGSPASWSTADPCPPATSPPCSGYG